MTRHLSVALTIGAVIPAGKTVSAVRLNGAPAAYTLVGTARGQEVLVNASTGSGMATLVVTLS